MSLNNIFLVLLVFEIYIYGTLDVCHLLKLVFHSNYASKVYTHYPNYS